MTQTILVSLTSLPSDLKVTININHLLQNLTVFKRKSNKSQSATNERQLQEVSLLSVMQCANLMRTA